MTINLNILIEINGNEVPAGKIEGESIETACFSYMKEYISNGFPGISICLPIQKEPFSPTVTRTFFEGLLPEGFTRHSVSKWLHIDENDYLSLLYGLGQECLGAIRVTKNDIEMVEASYEPLTMLQVRALANEGAVKSTELVTQAHLSLAGASGKVGLYLGDDGCWYLPKGSAPSTHIIKQSHVRYSQIVVNEQLSLMTASQLGFDIPNSFIINTGNANDEDILFATERYDRRIEDIKEAVDGLSCPLRLHQEDFGQALAVSTIEKYEKKDSGILRSMFEILRSYASDPIKEQLKLWDSIIFHFLLGNTDCHVKNFALLYGKNLREIKLSPMYDAISTIIYSGINRDMPFYIGGEKNIDRIGRSQFEIAAKEVGLGKTLAMNRFDALQEQFDHALSISTEQLMDEGYLEAKRIKEKILEREKLILK